jgi:hypothetical protein
VKTLIRHPVGPFIFLLFPFHFLLSPLLLVIIPTTISSAAAGRYTDNNLTKGFYMKPYNQ